MQKQNAGTSSSGSHFIRTLLRLGKCSAVTSPSDSSSTQPGTWRQSKTFPPPCRQQRDGEGFFFHGPLLLPINASTTTRYDQCWLHGYHPCLARHRAYTMQNDEHYHINQWGRLHIASNFGTSNLWQYKPKIRHGQSSPLDRIPSHFLPFTHFLFLNHRKVLFTTTDYGALNEWMVTRWKGCGIQQQPA